MTNNQSDNQLQLKWLWISLGAIMLLIVAVASLIPSPDMGVSDKLMHTVTYFILSAWFSVIVRRVSSLAIVFIGLVCFGLMLEQLQSMTGYRMMELADAFANGLGALLGLVIFFTPLKILLERIDKMLAGFKA